MSQLLLFEQDFGRSEVAPSSFAQILDGETYEPECDGVRLGKQALAVFELMSDGRWRTLGEIVAAIGSGSEAGVSARLRDFRKQKFGGHVVNRSRRGVESVGCFEYQLEVLS